MRLEELAIPLWKALMFLHLILEKKNCLATFKSKIHQFQNRSFYSIIGEKVGFHRASLYMHLLNVFFKFVPFYRMALESKQVAPTFWLSVNNEYISLKYKVQFLARVAKL